MTQHTVNLWECLGSLHEQGLPASSQVTDGLLQALSYGPRYHMQELTLSVVDEGWLIKVFSADSQADPGRVEILIPRDHTKPVKIIADIVGRIQHPHD